MPDGVMAEVQRRVAVFDSAKVGCPRCARLLRITVGEGDVLLTCEHRTQGIPCGQKIGVVGLPGRVCFVVGLSREEFGEIQTAGLEPGMLLRRLGLIGVTLFPVRAA